MLSQASGLVSVFAFHLRFSQGLRNLIFRFPWKKGAHRKHISSMGCLASFCHPWANLLLGVWCRNHGGGKPGNSGSELWEDCMRRGLWVQHVAGRQYVWVLINALKTPLPGPSTSTIPSPFLSNLVVSVSTWLVLHQPFYLSVTKICKPCLTFQECWTNTGFLQKQISAEC